MRSLKSRKQFKPRKRKLSKKRMKNKKRKLSKRLRGGAADNLYSNYSDKGILGRMDFLTEELTKLLDKESLSLEDIQMYKEGNALLSLANNRQGRKYWAKRSEERKKFDQFLYDFSIKHNLR